MVTPEARRELVRYTRERYGISERQACKIFSIARSVNRYRKQPDKNIELRERIKKLAARRNRWGCPLLLKALRREGVIVNHKRVERLYREENLALRRKKRGKRIRRERPETGAVQTPNTLWAIDFIHDSLWNGRRIKALTVIDCHSRFCPAIEVDFSLPAERVVAVLNKLAATRGLPDAISLDNGSEFTGSVFTAWAQTNNVELKFIQPGKPMQNGFIESFNGIFRHECLDANWFTSLSNAKEIIERWRNEYNQERPHGSIQDRTPEEIEIDFFNYGTKLKMDLI